MPFCRRLREQNPAFHRRAGQWAAAGEVLQAAGFVRQGANPADPMWVLQRNDPGLLWLALSAVREGLPELLIVRGANSSV